MAKRKDKRRKSRWSYTAGSYPHSVRVYERGRGGVLYAAAWDGIAGRELKRSLGHRDKGAAKEYADEQAAKLRKGLDDIRAAKPTARRVLKLYKRHRTPDKSPKMRKEDARQIDLWTAFLGANFDLSMLSRREWDGFVRQRGSGEIDARGKRIANEGKRRGVGSRIVKKDLTFLRTVCGWACDFRDEHGRLLLERDPTRGYEVPVEKNPERPVTTHERVDAIRKVYRQITMRVERGAKRGTVESWATRDVPDCRRHWSAQQARPLAPHRGP